MQYLCAMKRAWRKEHGESDAWMAELAGTPGVTLVGEPLFGRQTIEVDKATLDTLMLKFGDMLHFEPVSEYRQLDE